VKNGGRWAFLVGVGVGAGVYVLGAAPPLEAIVREREREGGLVYFALLWFLLAPIINRIKN
jgi:hypothetical protein